MSIVVLSALTGIVVVVGILVFARRADHQRTEAMTAAARAIGFVPDPDAEPRLERALAGFALRQLGGGGKFRRIYRASAATPRAWIFDYEAGSGEDLIARTAICLRTDGVQLLSFTLEPEGIFERVLSAFGRQDIDFPERPVFSKRYTLQAPDEAEIRRRFPDELAALLETSEAVDVEAKGDTLLIHRKRTRPEELGHLVERGLQILRLLVTATANTGGHRTAGR